MNEALARWVSVSGFVDIVLLVLIAEALWLVWRGHRAIAVLAALGPALLIMGAWRAALGGVPLALISLLLGGAFVFHLLDLRSRALPK